MIDIEWAKRNLTSNMHGVRAHSQLERAQHAKNRQHKLMLMVTGGGNKKSIDGVCPPRLTSLEMKSSTEVTNCLFRLMPGNERTSMQPSADNSSIKCRAHSLTTLSILSCQAAK